MENDQICPQRSLANNSVCRITQCAHGTIHLHIGALSIRMTPYQMRELGSGLDVATHKLPMDKAEQEQRVLC